MRKKVAIMNSTIKAIVENGDKSIVQFKHFKNHVRITLSRMFLDEDDMIHAYYLQRKYRVEQTEFNGLIDFLKMEFENTCDMNINTDKPCVQISIKPKNWLS